MLINMRGYLCLCLFLILIMIIPGLCLSAEADLPGKIVNDISNRIKEAEANNDTAVLLLQLRACVDHAKGFKGEKDSNPYYVLLTSCLGPNRSSALRMAAVKAITSPAPGDKIYIEGIDLLLIKFIGDSDRNFRYALRDELINIAKQNIIRYQPLLENMIVDNFSSCSVIEDAAYILWELNPSGTINSLIKGLSGRINEKRDSAVFYWLLTEYLHHRESSLAAWKLYLEKNKDLTALKETHFIRTRIEIELVKLFNSASRALEKAVVSDEGNAAYWRFVKAQLNSNRVALREKACVELKSLAQKTINNKKLLNSQVLLKDQMAALMKLLGAGHQKWYEPLSVKLLALHAIISYGSIAASDPGLSKFLADSIAQKNNDPEFQLEVLRTAGELRITALRGPLCDFVLNFDKSINSKEIGVLVEAVKSLGKLGFEPNAKSTFTDKVILSILNHLQRFQTIDNPKRGDYCSQLVKSLGKLGNRASSSIQMKLNLFLKNIISNYVEKNPSLVFLAINALGDLGGSKAIGDLSDIIGNRTDYQPNQVRAAVDALWMIGSSQQSGILEKVIKAFVNYLESGDSTLDAAIKQKILFLCRSSLADEAILANELVIKKKFKSAIVLLTGEDVVNLKRKAFASGTEKDLKNLWIIEINLLKSFDALEDYNGFLANVVTLKGFISDSKRGALLSSVSGVKSVAMVDNWIALVKKRKDFIDSLNTNKPEVVNKKLKDLLQNEKSLIKWALEKIANSGIASKMVDLLIKDSDAMKNPDISNWIKIFKTNPVK